jgi:hypothetical protein
MSLVKCGVDEHLNRHAVDEARMTRGVGTLALACDSTFVPSGYRALVEQGGGTDETFKGRSVGECDPVGRRFVR